MSKGKKVSYRKISRYTPLFGVIGLVLVLLTLRIQSDMQSQSITLIVPVARTVIYLDGHKETVTKIPNEKVVITPEEGSHFIIASRDDYWPWQKSFTLTKGDNEYTTVFTVKQDPVYSLVPEYTLEEKGVQNDAYTKIIKQFEQIQEKKTSESALVSIELNESKDNIVATWLGEETSLPHFFCIETKCDSSFEIMPSAQHVRSFNFYPNRDDVIAFASGPTVWIIELDRNEIQNAQPLYTGVAPECIPGPGNTLYVRDKQQLMLINV